MWQRESGQLLSQLKSHYQVVNTMSWSAQHNIFVSGSDDTSVKVWACSDLKFELSSQKAVQVRSLQRLRQESSDSDDRQDDDHQMQEDFKSRGSDEYMSE